MIKIFTLEVRVGPYLLVFGLEGIPFRIVNLRLRRESVDGRDEHEERTEQDLEHFCEMSPLKKDEETR